MEQPNKKLYSVIDEVATRISKVADLVDLAFPDKKAGVSLKASVDTLKTYVVELEKKADKTNLVTGQIVTDYNGLKSVAFTECFTIFKRLSEITLVDDSNINRFQTLGDHACKLLDVLLKYEKGNTNA